MKRKISLGTLDYFGTKELYRKTVPVLEEYMPENGKFDGIVFYFDSEIYASIFLVSFEADKNSPNNMRRVYAGAVFPDGSEREKKVYLFTGTKDDVIYYIKSEKASDFIIGAIVNMDHRIWQIMEEEKNANKG